MMRHLECGQTLKLTEIVKKLPYSLANEPKEYGVILTKTSVGGNQHFCNVQKCRIIDLRNTEK